MSRIPPLPWLPNALLGLLTLACFGGPLAIWLAVRGGSSSEWPPDRAIEWIICALVSAAAAALFLACVTVGWWHSGAGPRQGTRRRLNPGDLSAAPVTAGIRKSGGSTPGR